MARIRTIKPEFPQSESMGRVSRDARLCFIELWTIADDSGRLRGNPKMLASLLFPYDDDAPGLIGGWLDELEDEGCIQQYKAEGQSYLQITNWGEHQKIDKPTPSKIPGPDGSIERRHTEHDIEMILFERFKAMESIFGRKIIDVQRQVRVGSSYLDIVVTTDGPRYIFELKKNRLTVSDLKQVDGYAQTTGGVPILVGAGLSPLFPASEAERLGVAVISISEDNSLSLIIPSNNVKECSITLSSVTGSYSLDQGPRTKEEDQGACSAREAGPVDNLPEPTEPQVPTACLPAGYKTRIQEAVSSSSSRISTAEYEDIALRLFTLYPNADSAAAFVAYVLERSQGKDVRNSGAMIRSALLGRPGFELWPEDYEASKRERRSETHREPTPLAPVPPDCYCGGALKVNRQLGQGQCVECGTFWEWDASLKEWIVSEAAAVEA